MSRKMTMSFLAQKTELTVKKYQKQTYNGWKTGRNIKSRVTKMREFSFQSDESFVFSTVVLCSV